MVWLWHSSWWICNGDNMVCTCPQGIFSSLLLVLIDYTNFFHPLDMLTTLNLYIFTFALGSIW
uniref:Gpm440 n=1 Tax=Arundo donax TaxID=35708 RepID=A0A0A9D7R6_ARUDO